MPHHFIDIVRADFSRWVVPDKSAIGHRVREACIQLFADRDTLIELADGVDDICQTCDRLVDGRCDNTIDTEFRKGAPALMYDYNRLIDQRWRDRLGLATGDRLTATEFCRRMVDRAGDIASIYPETPAQTMVEWSKNIHVGLANYLDDSKPAPEY